MVVVSVHDYVFDRCEDIHRSGALVLRLETEDLAGGLVQIESSLAFGRSWEGLLEVWELLEEDASGRVHRLQYSYQLMFRDQLLFRYDRDPDNHPEMPEHKHLPPERRIASGPVTFREVLDEAYAVVAEREAAAAEEEE